MLRIWVRLGLAISSYLILDTTLAHAQTTARVSIATGGFQSNAANGLGDMTPDGRYVVFTSSATNLTVEGLPGLFRHDRLSGTTMFIASGFESSISDDGQFVAFSSTADNLVPNDTNGIADVFIWSAADGSFQRASVQNDGQIGGGRPQISGAGRFVAFVTSLGTTGQTMVFDRVLQTTTNGGFDGRTAYISADGRYLAYTSIHPEGTADSNSFLDVLRLDRQTGTKVIVSTTAGGVQGDANAQAAGVSADGRYVLLTSAATNFAATPGPGSPNLFIKDVQSGALTQVNLNESGQRIDLTAFAAIGEPTISASGRFVVFASSATNAVLGDTNGFSDTFLVDRDTAVIVRVNLSDSGSQAAGGSSGFGVASDDGALVAFFSNAHNLVAGDTNFEPDVFVRDFSGAPPCTVSMSPSGLAVVSSNGGNGSLAVTAPSTCAWTASVNVPWIRVTNMIAGVGDGTVSYNFDPYFGGSTIRSGAIVINTAAHGLRQLGTTTQPPFGPVETPTGGPTPPSVSGAVGFTGWALDDVQVTRIRLYRSPVTGEGIDQIFIGDGVKVANARPDVAALNPAFPYNTEAGWGLMVLTNMLPNQGNGTFTFYVYYDDADGHTRLAGTRTLNVVNATATDPFGTIDTPAQGQTVSGTIVNFGWALTPQPGTIPTNGSTIDVYIDGVNVGHPTYNQFRSDIATLFPGYANSNGAIGHFTIDTTTYADGVHTIAWVVTDNLGRASGLGSRYFTIQNGPNPVTPPYLRRSHLPMRR